jgi:solute carrier family 35 protein C2
MREQAIASAHLAAQEAYAPVRTRDPDTVGAAATSSSSRPLIRPDLQMAPGVRSASPLVDSPSRMSPVKRPEDLE